VIKRVASKHHLDVARTILIYLICKGFIVLPKSVHEERIITNIMLEGIHLDAQDMEDIEELSK
jgi:diketogulonate reductase-like aldo/keto reductase